MNASNRIISNVQHLLDTYKNKLNDDKRLVLTYWMAIDGVEMNKEHISTPDFLTKATNAADIINARTMIKLMENK